jgi:hypothetical protein
MCFLSGNYSVSPTSTDRYLANTNRRVFRIYDQPKSRKNSMPHADVIHAYALGSAVSWSKEYDSSKNMQKWSWPQNELKLELPWPFLCDGGPHPVLDFDDHLQRLVIRSLGKSVVGGENFRHLEMMGDQALRVDFPRLHRPKQHGCCHGIHQSGPQGDVM